MKRECRCAPSQVQRYRQRISGPLLDRIDIHVEVPAVVYKDLAGEGGGGEPSGEIRARVEAAREIQRERFGRKHGATPANASMSSKQLKAFCKLDSTSSDLLKMAMNELNLSARAYDRILKVSRTIADLARSEAITAEHISEAIQYRTLDRNLWV